MKFIDKYGLKKTEQIYKSRSEKLKNKSYEDLYGVEKAKIMKEKLSKAIKGKTLIERYGEEKAQEIKSKQSMSMKGNWQNPEKIDKWQKTRHVRSKGEFKHTEQTKAHISQLQKGKTWEDRLGKEKANELKKKLAQNKLHKGHKHTEETKGIIRQKALGRKHTPEQIQKQIQKQKGRVISNITKQKISIAHMGKTADEATKRKQSEVRKRGLANGTIKVWNQGLTKENCSSLIRPPMSEATKQKIKKAVLLAWQDPDKRKNMQYNGLKHFKGGYREDLGHYVRSAFEANYCRFLKWFGVQYEYETDKCSFSLKNDSNYICDFYLPEIDQYIELKGYMRQDAQNKIDMFKQEYPQIKWHILFQNSEEWEKILVNYNHLIPNWEYNKKEKSIINKFKNDSLSVVNNE